MRYRTYQSFGLNPLWVLIIINILLFIATVINPKIPYLLGLQPALVQTRPWTLVTSLFIHAGLWHLFANMITFYFFGRYLASLVGGRKFLIVYFGGGILGSILVVFLAPPFLAVGASGAVFALGGALAAMRPKVPVLVFPIPAPIPLWVAVIGGFIILTIVSRFLPIAWQAHLGGLVFGLVAGYFFRKRERYYYF